MIPNDILPERISIIEVSHYAKINIMITDERITNGKIFYSCKLNKGNNEFDFKGAYISSTIGNLCFDEFELKKKMEEKMPFFILNDLKKIKNLAIEQIENILKEDTNIFNLNSELYDGVYYNKLYFKENKNIGIEIPIKEKNNKDKFFSNSLVIHFVINDINYKYTSSSIDGDDEIYQKVKEFVLERKELRLKKALKII